MRHVITLAFLLTVNLFVQAKPVDPAVLRLAAERVLGRPVVDATPASWSECRLYHGADGRGFVMLSADDCATPLLAYSTAGSFPTDPALMPEHVAAWLDGYRSQLAFARSNGLEASPQSTAAWQALLSPTPKSGSVEPLLTTAWGQGTYYNSLCPNGALVGCVAVALGQIVRYWGYPTSGRGSHAYYSYAALDTLRVDFATANYQWDLMPDSLSAASTPDNITAVARLLADLGIGLSMQYGSGTSIAYVSSYASLDSASAESVLREHLYYAPSLHSLFKRNHTDAEWRALAKAELDARRPILYAAYNPNGGGHAFVVDGYDQRNLFHVNWGWNGLYNGYFTLDSLFIQASSGASVSFHLNNEMIVGIAPVYPTASAYSLTGISADTLLGTVAGSGTIAADSLRATLLATAAEGYVFTRWSSGAINNPRLYSPTADLSDTAHFRPLGGDTLAYCRDFGYDWYSTPASASLTWGIRIPPSLIARHRQLQQVQFVTVDPGTYHLRVYSGHNLNVALHAEDYTFNAAGWQTVDIGYSLPVYDTAPLWITLTTSGIATATQRSLYTGNPDGSLLLDGDTWRPSHEVDGTYGSWMIRAILAESEKVSLTIHTENGHCGHTTGAGLYYPGDTATVEAFPAENNCRFVCWSDGSTENPYSFIIEANLVLTAIFDNEVSINEAEGDGIGIALRSLELTIDNPQGHPLALYDVMGRPIHTFKQANSQTYPLPCAGVYFLQAAGFPAHRIVAVK